MRRKLAENGENSKKKRRQRDGTRLELTLADQEFRNSSQGDMEMKKMMMVLLMSTVSVAMIESARAQATATQTVTLAVNAVYKIADLRQSRSTHDNHRHGGFR